MKTLNMIYFKLNSHQVSVEYYSFFTYMVQVGWRDFEKSKNGNLDVKCDIKFQGIVF